MSHSNENLCETHIIGSTTREYIVSKPASQALALYSIELAGISYARAPFRFVRLRPARFQLLICLQGSGQVLIDDQWQLCTPGMAYLTPPGVLHAYHACDDQDAWKVCWLNYMPHHERTLIAGEKPVLLAAEAPELALAIEGLYHEHMGHAEDVIMQQWAQMIHRYAQRIIHREQFDMRLSQLWKTVDANLAYSWNGEELATVLNMSSEHLRRLCQQQCGHSPMRHVTMMRMQRAMALLVNESYSIAAIARNIGYENPFAFSTAFKRFAGVSPSIYRNNP